MTQEYGIRTMMTRKIRVRHVNAEKLVEALRVAGFQAEYLGPGTAYTRWCWDPSHCLQHPCDEIEPKKWGSILTDASGRQAHKVWVAARLVLDWRTGALLDAEQAEIRDRSKGPL